MWACQNTGFESRKSNPISLDHESQFNKGNKKKKIFVEEILQCIRSELLRSPLYIENADIVAKDLGRTPTYETYLRQDTHLRDIPQAGHPPTRHTSGRTPNSRHISGRTPNSRHTSGRTPNSRHTSGRTPNSRHSSGRKKLKFSKSI
ncbi:scp extracellular domain containing protein [Plakobranchus ocellatus]|uniref:Scp extracellular domain containing protein n=1 Tax=Plakobranchus ocellatus TaxID=259542 RepID=A0AAV3Z0C1_9GAST|nr:scp extracellular domain containing protein [Plakobranchus ocellatus]